MRQPMNGTMRQITSLRRPRIRACYWVFILCCTVAPGLTTTTSGGGMVLRVRLVDGSMERIQVPPGAQETMTLHDILKPVTDDSKDCKVRIETSQDEIPLDEELSSQTISSLGLQHGSLLTLVRKTLPKQHQQPSRFSAATHRSDTDRCFDPFPELAKHDYETAVRRKQQRRGGMSYKDIAHIQSALHVVEPQNEGPLLRVYMCGKSAERFQVNGIVLKSSSSSQSQQEKSSTRQQQQQPRVGLLLGTIQRERVEMKPVKARTSLSSAPSDADFCQVAKVHAIWEPPQTLSADTQYDIKGLLEALQSGGSGGGNDAAKRVEKVALWLGLRPVGWIFSYTNPRLDQGDDSLPVWGIDVVHGAQVQSALMQSSLGRAKGAQCVTLAMDAKTGATEAFQLSNVSVQMVAEGMLQVPTSSKSSPERLVNMKHEILVDGQETKTLDSVLCLVNTALLSHEGSYASSSLHSLKKNGSLTRKSKKILLKAMEEDQTDQCNLLSALSDFNVLLALDQLLPERQSEELCLLVRKWVRGQRKGTQVGSELKVTLQSLLST